MLILSHFFNMKNIFLIIIFNIIYSNINYEIIHLPKNIYSLNSNSGVIKQIKNHRIQKHSYSMSFLQYPANISLFNFSTQNNLYFSMLDYGILENKINDEVFNSFKSYELLVGYNFLKEQKNYFFNISPNIVYSKINAFSSTALFTDLAFLFHDTNHKIYFSASIKNIGILLDSFTENTEYMPIKYHIGISKELDERDLNLAFDVIYYEVFDKLNYSISLDKKINQKFLLLLNLNSNRNNLNTNNLFNNIFSGFSGALIIKESFFNIGLGISALGPAGNLYCLSFEFK